MPRLQSTHAHDCACMDCLTYRGIISATGGTVPNTFMVTGTGINTRPCGGSWLFPCPCYQCNPQLKFTYTTHVLPEHKKVEEEIKKSPIINDFKKDLALDKALKFLSGLSLQHHSVSTQKEQADVLREIMKVLKPERYNK